MSDDSITGIAVLGVLLVTVGLASLAGIPAALIVGGICLIILAMVAA